MCGNGTTLTNRKALYTVVIRISQIDRITDRLSLLSSMKAQTACFWCTLQCEHQAVMQHVPALRSSVQSSSISWVTTMVNTAGNDTLNVELWRSRSRWLDNPLSPGHQPTLSNVDSHKHRLTYTLRPWTSSSQGNRPQGPHNLRVKAFYVKQDDSAIILYVATDPPSSHMRAILMNMAI